MNNFRPDGTAFMTSVMWMYRNLVAAQSIVVLMSCLFPNFVATLALTAMANGIWMICNGFMFPGIILNPFYRYVFYYINYQACVFRGLAVNEFGYRIYSCDDACYCRYNTALRSQCMIDGAGVMEQYACETGGEAKLGWSYTCYYCGIEVDGMGCGRMEVNVSIIFLPQDIFLCSNIDLMHCMAVTLNPDSYQSEEIDTVRNSY